MTAYFLAIDGGSQSTKVSVIDETGRVVASARVPLQPYQLGPAGLAVHPGELFAVLVVRIEGLGRISTAFGADEAEHVRQAARAAVRWGESPQAFPGLD